MLLPPRFPGCFKSDFVTVREKCMHALSLLFFNFSPFSSFKSSTNAMCLEITFLTPFSMSFPPCYSGRLHFISWWQLLISKYRFLNYKKKFENYKNLFLYNLLLLACFSVFPQDCELHEGEKLRACPLMCM